MITLIKFSALVTAVESASVRLESSSEFFVFVFDSSVLDVLPFSSISLLVSSSLIEEVVLTV